MTAERPNREQVVKTFGREAAEFIEVAASLGWKVVFNNTGTSITVVSYDERKRLHLSSRNKGGGLFRKYSKTLAKFAEPDRAGTVIALSETDLPHEVKREVNLMLGAIELNREDGAVVLPEEPKKERFVPTPAAVAERVKDKRHIVSERPAMMHLRPGTDKRPGKSYPSLTTIERRWSDGSIDYACAVPTCGETSENRLAFRGPHWAMHVRKGEAEPVDDDKSRRGAVDDPSYTESAYSRKQSLKEKRRRELSELLKGINLAEISEEDLADQIMEYLESQMGGGGGGPLEPLTPEQIIDRIRTLVDTGTYSEQEQAIRERDQQIEELMAYAEERETALQTDLLEAKQHAALAEARLEALRDLINEEVGKEKKE